MKRTGSELVLFNLLRKLSPEFKARVVTKYEGELTKDLPEGITSESLYSRPGNSLIQRLINGLNRRLMVNVRLSKYKKTTWYINTISLPDVLEYAKDNKIKTIVHLHELEQRFAFLSEEQIKTLVEYPDLIIANSNTSKAVIEKYGRKDRIEVCYPVTDMRKMIHSKELHFASREKLGVARDESLWVMCGTLDGNKDPLFFIDIAKQVCARNEKAKFMWNGSVTDPELFIQCKKRTKELGLDKRIIWQVDAPDAFYEYFNCADGFVLTSKRESFSLVTLEALYLELPVVARDCGGVKEVLGNDVGYVGNEVDELAGAIMEYINGSRVHDGRKGRDRMLGLAMDKIPEKWNNILMQELK